MGVVYRARDLRLDRDVAVKRLSDNYPADSVVARRFVDEARITGQLQHPGIPAVHELGELPDGRPFLAMKLVKGRTLDHELRDRPDPTHDRGRFVAIFDQVCQAVGYAHERRVIHRDLKPANVMVGSFGEVQVMDWGLAKLLTPSDRIQTSHPDPEATVGTEIRTARDSDGTFTQAGSVLGTLAFMPPEQAAGEVEKIDERADVFGLGAILCVILTGQPPYVGPEGESVRLMAVRGQLAECLARLDASGAEPGLVGLCRTCLAFTPADRPADAGAVAKAVAEYRADAEQRARQAELDQAKAEAEAREQRKRRRVQLALAAAVLALVGVGGTGAWAVASQRAERRAATERMVNDALVKAAGLRGRAAAAPVAESAEWDEALAEVRRAEDAIAQGTADDDLRGRVAAARAELERLRDESQRRAEAAAAQRRLVARMAQVRNNSMVDQDSHEVLAREYVAILRELGVDVAQDPQEAGARLASHPAAAEIIAALDTWAGHLLPHIDNSFGPMRRLIEVVRAADPDSWRDELRKLALAPRDELAEGIPRLVADRDNLDRQPVHSLILFAGLLRSVGDEEGAFRVYSVAWRRAPDDPWVNWLIGMSSWKLDRGLSRPDQARRFLTAAVTARPGSDRALFNLGQALLLSREFAEAADVFRELIRRGRHSASVNSGLALVSSRGGLALALAGQGKLAEAVAACREAVRLNSDIPEAHLNLAFVLDLAGDPAGAREAQREGVRLKVENPDAPRVRGAYTLDLTDDLAGAVVPSRETVRFRPDVPRVYAHLGTVLRLAGDPAGARAAFEEAIRRDPEFALAHRHLAWLLAAGPDGIRAGKQAVEHATRACELTGWKHPELIDTLAAAYAEAGDFARAVEYQKKALAFPTFEQAHGAAGREKLALFAQKKSYRDADLARRELAPPPREVK
jgi:serine/threonine-protein kinase